MPSREELEEVFVLPPGGALLADENGSGLSDEAVKKIKDRLEKEGVPMAHDAAPVEVVLEAAKMIKVDVGNEENINPNVAIVAERFLSYGDYMKAKRLFKAEAPWTDYPLNDKQITHTMELFAHQFPDFYPYEFCMSNFLGEPSASLQTHPIELYKRGFRSWGCVLNTDVYQGRGKHWVCIYGEMRDEIWTLEYFNSSSNAPFPDVRQYFDICEKEFVDYGRSVGKNIIVRRVLNPNDYQRGEGHHCGVYTLIYIWQRLNGVPADKYLRKKISNSHVLAFRKYIFLDPSLH